jgi:hypothetical protein
MRAARRGDGDQLGGELGQLLRGEAGAGGEPLCAQRELFRGRGAPCFVAACLGLRLVDEELDLLDLALQVGGFAREAGGKIRGRGDPSVGRRLRRALRLGGGLRGDLSPPAS